MSVSVRLSVRSFDQVLTRLYLEDYSSVRFQILYGDCTLLEDVERRSFD